jgi:pyridoxal phosphate enzyme (YggS family)
MRPIRQDHFIKKRASPIDLPGQKVKNVVRSPFQELVFPMPGHIVRAMDLAANLAAIEARMTRACDRVSRARSDVTLVAITKGQPPRTVEAAARLGLTLFGENRVQEAKAKIGLCPGRLRWHMVGHVQTNKARDCVRLFEMIQSVDSTHLAMEIEKCAANSAKTLPVLIEVNVAGESSKFGYGPSELLAEASALNRLRHIEIQGLMTMAPWTTDAERVRPVFRRLRELKSDFENSLGAPLPHLSMGMSADFEVAIEEGATIVRIGTALFGERPTTP